MHKQITLFDKSYSVPKDAKWVFVFDDGAAYWSVERPKQGKYTWDMRPCETWGRIDNERIEQPEWFKLIKRV